MVITTARSTQAHIPSGLSSADVADRVRRGLSNDYEARVNRTYWDIFRDNVLNLFNIALFMLLVLVLVMHDYWTVFFAGFSVVSNTFLGMLQEMNAKRRLDNLAALTTQRALVWRDGRQQDIPMRQVVMDDIVMLEPGIKAVVDGDLISSDSLEMDESMLTGESDAVYKEAGKPVYSGSFCIAGTGLMRATAVGRESRINQLSEIARTYKYIRTPTQKRLDTIVELSVVAMFVFVPLLFIRNLIIESPTLPLLDAVRNVVVFVTTLVPQGLVLTATLSLTIGAIKISRHETLIQKVNAVESLANATVLCFDKTGTLTKNQLAVDEIIALNHVDKEAIIQQLADYLDNLAHLNRTAAALKQYIDQHARPNGQRKQHEIPFTSGRKWGAVVISETTLILGAPERLLTADDAAMQQATRLSQQGNRVLAFGHTDDIPQNHTPSQVKPVALIVMSDQIRDDIQATLQAFRDVQIQLKVISGDNLETVRAIARQSGMRVDNAYTGEQIDNMSDGDLAVLVRDTDVYARIEPHTKQRIIRSLQTNGEYVAMVGDGVNDVPALKQADLAIVMNDGTQISKDVADIVLLNNAMSTLPYAFMEGTEITQTIFATTKLFMTRSLYSVTFFVFTLFTALPFPITPIQISWATFGSMNIPASLLALAIIRPQFMRNFRDDVMDAILTGGLVGAVLLTVLYVTVYLGSGRNLGLARSAVTLFAVLFNAYIVLIVQGVDFMQPGTYLLHKKSVAIMIGLSVLTVWAMYLAPHLLEFTVITFKSSPLIVILMSALAGLAMVLAAYFERNRALLRRFWQLLEHHQSDDQNRQSETVRF